MALASETDPSGAPSAAVSPEPSQSAAETTSPDPSPPAPAVTPKLFVVLAQPGTALHGGDSVNVSVHVYATDAEAPDTLLHFAATSNAAVTPRCDDRKGSDCELGSVDAEGKFVSVTVAIPKSMTSGSVTLSARASSGTVAKLGQSKITVTKRPASSTPSTGTSGGSSSPTGSTGAGGVGTSAGAPPTIPDTGFVPASPAGVLQNPQVALPQIAPQAPATAPTVAAAAPNTLRSGGIPGAQELTFERLASTQAAWLAALLVAFSLLMTQLRLVRPYNARWTGDHRRPRHGLFQR